MPVIIPKDLPAWKLLEAEGVPLLEKPTGALPHLKIAVLNLMPEKEVTEKQLARLLASTAYEVEPIWLYTATRRPSPEHTPPEHLDTFYKTFADIKGEHFDGLIITGAPVETLPYEEKDEKGREPASYLPELFEIIDWSEAHTGSALFVCWGAQAALYRKFRIPKYELDKKMFGVFEHRVLFPAEPIARGFNDRTFAPHSRHTEIRREDIEKVPELKIICESDEAGVYMVASARDVFISGHSEYDGNRLKLEYDRDIRKGLPIHKPVNYYPGDDETKDPIVRWREHAHLLFSNWLTHYVAKRRFHEKIPLR
jgi:homoserine O-succinyltransferase